VALLWISFRLQLRGSAGLKPASLCEQPSLVNINKSKITASPLGKTKFFDSLPEIQKIPEPEKVGDAVFHPHMQY
jgi:hypothetical protein